MEMMINGAVPWRMFELSEPASKGLVGDSSYLEWTEVLPVVRGCQIGQMGQVWLCVGCQIGQNGSGLVVCW